MHPGKLHYRGNHLPYLRPLSVKPGWPIISHGRGKLYRETPGSTFKAAIPEGTLTLVSSQSSRARPVGCPWEPEPCLLKQAFDPASRGSAVHSRPVTRGNLGGVKEESCLSLSLPAGEGRRTTLPAACQEYLFPSNVSVSTYQEGWWHLVAGFPAQAPSGVCTQNRTGGLRRHG